MSAKTARAAFWFFTGSAAALLVAWNALPSSQAACRDDPCAVPPCCNGDVTGDGSIDIADAIALLSHLFARGPEPARITAPLSTGGGSLGGPLPATGQTTCYNVVWPAVPCDDPAFPGQDGSYRAGCPLAERYVDNGDGTVTDACTGLTWQKESAPDRHDWQQALQLCESMALGGHTDWRLPNVRELQSIVDYGRDHPAIDPVFEAAMSWYWSSSTLVVTPSDAWAVCFGYGGAVLEFGKTGDFHVRAVRGP